MSPPEKADAPDPKIEGTDRYIAQQITRVADDRIARLESTVLGPYPELAFVVFVDYRNRIGT